MPRRPVPSRWRGYSPRQHSAAGKHRIDPLDITIYDQARLKQKGCPDIPGSLFSKVVLYGTPKRSWVSRSALLYQGSQKLLLSSGAGKPIISEKLVLIPFTL
jgi:hypothetical protein